MSETKSKASESEDPVEIELVVKMSPSALLGLRHALAGVPQSAADCAQEPPRGSESTGPDPWLDNKEAAAYLGLSLNTIYKYASQKRLAYRKLGGRLAFRKSALDDFIQQQIHPARRCAGGQDLVDEASVPPPGTSGQ